MEEETNLLGLLQNVDADKVGDVLKEFEKYEKILDKVSGLIMRLDRTGVLPAALRMIGAKSGVENIDAPLPQQNQLSVVAASPTHLMMYNELNKQPEETIAAMFKQAVLAGEKGKSSKT